MRANSIVNWFVAMFANLGVEGCSSHSGRRTFITAATKNVHRAGGSLHDVQMLAGHPIDRDHPKTLHRWRHTEPAPACEPALITRPSQAVRGSPIDDACQIHGGHHDRPRPLRQSRSRPHASP